MFGKKSKSENKTALGCLLDGLPVPQNTDLAITLTPEQLTLSGAGQEFEINLSKITLIDAKSETEMEKVIGQSASGMIIGAAAFGIIGAMVGGRVKTKDKRNVSHFMIINYESDGIKTILVETTKDWYNGAALVDYFRKLKPNVKPIKVQL